MSSNIRIPKVCELCGIEFIAMKLTTRFCSLKCGQKNYKKEERAKKIAECHISFRKTKKPTKELPSQNNLQKPYLSIKETCKLLNASDTTIRKAIKEGRINSIRIGKKHIIRRNDIELLFQLR